MAEGWVMGVYIGTEARAPLASVTEVRAEAGRGLEGDRYWSGKGTFWKPLSDREVTLIETEVLEALAANTGITLEPRDARRNLATRGVRLNALVNRRFRVGEALLLGIRLCEPCGHLEELTGQSLRPHLFGCGGLRAAIQSSGLIRVGDTISVETADAESPAAETEPAARATA
ncbi:MAG TPA: MOSC domain-containing protein [Terriglobia bacterium]|nr:MOSC domain-containing protein [Terriglobia bacterium]